MSFYGRDKRQEPEEDSKYKSDVLYINRVAKVLKGGRRFRFTALVVVGDGEGMVGMGLGKAPEVVDAIRKGEESARKNMVKVFRAGSTIPFEVKHTYCSTTVLLRPAREGAGITAGGAARPLLTLAGITDCTAKFYGSNNKVNCAKATFEALRTIELPAETIKHRQDRSYRQVITHEIRKASDADEFLKDENEPRPMRRQMGDRNRRGPGGPGGGGPGRGGPHRGGGGGGGQRRPMPGGGGRPRPAATAPAPQAQKPAETPKEAPATTEGGA
jgi:small subunit ribosomal protein S5